MRMISRMAAGVALGIMLASPVGTAHADGGWRIVSPTLTPGSVLNTVVATGPNDVWAGGSQAHTEIPIQIGGNPGSITLTTVATQRWNGTSWSSRNPGWLLPGSSMTNGASAAGPNNVWLQGQSGTDSYFEQWNGSYWQNHPLVNAAGVTWSAPMDLTAIPGGGTWALYRGLGQYTTYWDGSAWKNTPIDDNVYAIAAKSKTDAWAFGTAHEYHWDGTAWTVTATPANPDGRGVSDATYGPNGDLWTFAGGGYSSQDGHLMPAYLGHYAGGTWTVTKVTTGQMGTYNLVVDATGTPWGLGYGPGGTGTAITKWNGTTFEAIDLPTLPAGSRFNSMAVVPGTSTFWAVGSYPTGTKATDITALAITNG